MHISVNRMNVTLFVLDRPGEGKYDSNNHANHVAEVRYGARTAKISSLRNIEDTKEIDIESTHIVCEDQENANTEIRKIK